MGSREILSLYGLKWNPFGQDVPREALVIFKKIEHFCWKVENLVLDGGFALISGDPGLGKSIALRILFERLQGLREITIAELSRPQSGLADFYRELGSVFGVDLKVSNRWGGYSALRQRWQNHVDTTLLRPVLVIDEAQEMMSVTLSELRLLASTHFDSRNILTVILCGDSRLCDRFHNRDLLPLGSRIRTRLQLEPHSADELSHLLTESLKRAGNPNLMTTELIATLSEHSAGNPRVMMTVAGELLMLGVKKELKQLDEKLYLEAFTPETSKRRRQK
jgi:general secretion pathway protein A